MTLGYMKFTKIRCFNFLKFSCPRVHRISQKSNASFSQSFMTPGTRNFTKIKHSNFLEFSWPRVQEISQKSNASIFLNFHEPEISQKSNASIFSNFHDPGYTKFHKNQTLQFSRIFMAPGTGNFTKFKLFNFLEFS